MHALQEGGMGRVIGDSVQGGGGRGACFFVSALTLF